MHRCWASSSRRCRPCIACLSPTCRQRARPSQQLLAGACSARACHLSQQRFADADCRCLLFHAGCLGSRRHMQNVMHACTPLHGRCSSPADLSLSLSLSVSMCVCTCACACVYACAWPRGRYSRLELQLGPSIHTSIHTIIDTSVRCAVCYECV